MEGFHCFFYEIKIETMLQNQWAYCGGIWGVIGRDRWKAAMPKQITCWNKKWNYPDGSKKRRRRKLENSAYTF